MGSLLAEGWLAGVDEEIRIFDEASVSQVREAVRRRGAAVGLAPEGFEALAAAASELAHNQLEHARFGAVGLRAIRRGGVAGLELVAADQGEGLVDPAAALRDAPRADGPGLGVGLAAARRLVDELDLDVRRGEGTCVRARRFVAPVPRVEIAVLARPFPGEVASGDHALAVSRDDALLLGVVDGLGHGAPARAAADAAVTALGGVDPGAPALDALVACDRALTPTRGAVMSVIRVDLAGRRLEHAAAGNVTTRLYGRGDQVSTFLNTARVLGTRPALTRAPVETHELGGESLLVAFTDGLTSRTELAPATMSHLPPIAIAQTLLERFARPDDDALVLVARLG